MSRTYYIYKVPIKIKWIEGGWTLKSSELHIQFFSRQLTTSKVGHVKPILGKSKGEYWLQSRHQMQNKTVLQTLQRFLQGKPAGEKHFHCNTKLTFSLFFPPAVNESVQFFSPQTHFARTLIFFPPKRDSGENCNVWKWNRIFRRILQKVKRDGRKDNRGNSFVGKKRQLLSTQGVIWI